MNSEQLFQMLGDLDDAFIQEAEAPDRPTPLWKIVAATAAVAAAAVGLVWFSARLLHPAPLKAGPPELAAPVVTAAPQTPELSPEPGGTATPAPDTGATSISGVYSAVKAPFTAKNSIPASRMICTARSAASRAVNLYIMKLLRFAQP